MSNKNDQIRYVLFLFDEMRSIINELIIMRNNSVKSKEMEKLDKENNALMKKRIHLLEARDHGLNLESIFDYIMNVKKDFYFKFTINRLNPFSLEQILDIDFYPDVENYPLSYITPTYRTIKSSPKRGNISPDLIKHAVKVVLSSIKKINKSKLILHS